MSEVFAAVGNRRNGNAGPIDYAISMRTVDGGIVSIALSYNALISVSDYFVIAKEEAFAIEGARARSSQRILLEGDARALEQRAVETQDAAMLHALRGGPDFPAEARSILPTIRVRGRCPSDTRGVIRDAQHLANAQPEYNYAGAWVDLSTATSTIP